MSRQLTGEQVPAKQTEGWVVNEERANAMKKVEVAGNHLTCMKSFKRIEQLERAVHWGAGKNTQGWNNPQAA
jgi:hypothetical protein